MQYLQGFGQAKESQINELCMKLDLTLPQDYKEFLMIYNGAKPTKKYLTFRSDSILSEDYELTVGSLFGIDVVKEEDIYFWHRAFGDELPESSLIIGCEDNSGFIVLINHDDEKGIFFWDDARILPESSDETNAYKISDTFSEFIGGLVLVE